MRCEGRYVLMNNCMQLTAVDLCWLCCGFSSRESSVTLHGELPGELVPFEWTTECSEGISLWLRAEFSVSLNMWQRRMLTRNQQQRQLIILMSKYLFLLDCYSKVSQRKISPKSRSDKCVHCEAKVELDKLKEFVTCKGKSSLINAFEMCLKTLSGIVFAFRLRRARLP